MEDRESPLMHKYGESKTAQITMATVRYVTSSSGLRKFQADGFFVRLSERDCCMIHFAHSHLRQYLTSHRG